MVGLGTIINVFSIIIGGLVGKSFNKLLSSEIQETLMKANGLAIFVLGFGGVLEKMFVIKQGQIITQGAMLLIVSLSLGGLIGEWLKIDALTTKFALFLSRFAKNQSGSDFVDGFVLATCTVCIGAMAVIGSVQDALLNDYSILIAKSILDAIIIAVMTSTKGIGCVFSAVPVFIFQMSVTILALMFGPVLSELAIEHLSLVGNVLMAGIGVNLIFGQTIRVINLLPAIAIAIIWAYLPFI